VLRRRGMVSTGAPREGAEDERAAARANEPERLAVHAFGREAASQCVPKFERVATEVPRVDRLDRAVAPGRVHEGVGVEATREAFGVRTDASQAGRVGGQSDLGRDLRHREHHEVRAHRPWPYLRERQVGECPAHEVLVGGSVLATDVDPLGKRSGRLDVDPRHFRVANPARPGRTSHLRPDGLGAVDEHGEVGAPAKSDCRCTFVLDGRALWGRRRVRLRTQIVEYLAKERDLRRVYDQLGVAQFLGGARIDQLVVDVDA